MAFHPVVNTAEIVLLSTFRGNERANVFHYQYNVHPTSADLFALLETLRLNLLPKIKPFTNNATHFYELKGTDIDAPGLATASLSLDEFGGNATASAPGNVAAVVSKRTAFTGRSHRGRWYTYDLPEGLIDGDTIQNALLSLLLDFAAQMLLSYVAGAVTFKPVVASKKLGTPAPLVSAIVDTITDSQRRRLTGRGS